MTSFELGKLTPPNTGINREKIGDKKKGKREYVTMQKRRIKKGCDAPNRGIRQACSFEFNGKYQLVLFYFGWFMVGFDELCLIF